MARQYGIKTDANVKKILKELGERVEKAAEEATKENAERLIEEMKNRVPVNSGRLRDSIHTKKTGKGATIKYKVIVDASDEKDYKYAKIVEFSPKINKPFMYPSFDGLRNSMKEHLINKIRKAAHK